MTILTIPPRRDAHIWQHGNCAGLPHPPDENLRRLRQVGRQQWKAESGYYRHSLVETARFRLKTIFGDRLRARGLAHQKTEARITSAAPDGMTRLGKPESYCVARARPVGEWEVCQMPLFTQQSPTLLKDIFALTPMDAGARVAGFVIVATSMRPVGGWLADRYGGAPVLTLALALISVLALGLTSSSMMPFTIGALGTAAMLGMGNGTVFKLVLEYFPRETGTVTGLVGAAGGQGGFFPPLVLGVIRQQTGSYGLGFVLLSGFALICLAVNYLVLLRRRRERWEMVAAH